METRRYRVLMLDDGEVEAGRVRFRLAALGVEVVVCHDLLELPALLETRPFHVVIGHELLVALALVMKHPARRCLLVNRDGPWWSPTLPTPAVGAVISTALSDAELLAVLDAGADSRLFAGGDAEPPQHAVH